MGLGFDDTALETWDGAGAMTFTVRASGDTIRFATLTEGRPAAFPTTATDGIAANEMPASTVFAMTGVDLYESFLTPAIDQAGALEAPLSDGSEAAGSVAQLGLGVDDDLLSHLVGQYSFSIAALTDNSSPFGFSGAVGFQSGVDDARAVTDLVNEVADSLGEIGVPMTRTDNGFSISGSGVPVFGDVAVDDNLSVSLRLGDGAGSGTLADEPNFIDMSCTEWLTTEDHVFIDGTPGPSAVKMVFPLKRQRHFSRAEGKRYWLDVHGPIVAAVPGLRRYVQSHTVDAAYRYAEPRWDGVAQLWLDDVAAVEKMLVDPAFKDVAWADTVKFVDMKTIESFVGEEYVVIP